MSKLFHLGDILSITTGCLVSPRHIDGIYDILNYMTASSLYTHQLPDAARKCAPELLRQHPSLQSVEFDHSLKGDKAVFTWLNEQVLKFGKNLPVDPLGKTDDYSHPVRDLVHILERIDTERLADESR